MICNFCGVEILPGTGKMFVRKDGSTFNFCSAKCQRNQLGLGRVARYVKWTKSYEKGAGASRAAERRAQEKLRAAAMAAPPKVAAEAKPTEAAAAKVGDAASKAPQGASEPAKAAGKPPKAAAKPAEKAPGKAQAAEAKAAKKHE